MNRENKDGLVFLAIIAALLLAWYYFCEYRKRARIAAQISAGQIPCAGMTCNPWTLNTPPNGTCPTSQANAPASKSVDTQTSQPPPIQPYAWGPFMPDVGAPNPGQAGGFLA